MLSIFPRDQRCTTHRQAHRGIIWENSRAFVPEWHRGPLNTGDSANVTVWKHQSINKTLLCRSKGFQHCSKRQKKKKKTNFTSEWEKEASSETEKRKLLPLPWKKKVQNRKKKEFSMRRNNQDGYFSAGCRCSLALSKLIVPIILQGGDTEK